MRTILLYVLTLSRKILKRLAKTKASVSIIPRYHMKDAILEGGIPFNRDHGKHVFEYSNMNPSFNQLFMAAMTNRATLIMKKIVECYMGFEHINRLVDVGGGLGVTLNKSLQNTLTLRESILTCLMS